MTWVTKFDVPSSTSDTTYVVGINEQGAFGCSCPHWKFCRAECKHIRTVKLAGASWTPIVEGIIEERGRPTRRIDLEED